MKVKFCHDSVASALALMLCWDRTPRAIPEVARMRDAAKPPKSAIVAPAARMPESLRGSKPSLGNSQRIGSWSAWRYSSIRVHFPAEKPASDCQKQVRESAENPRGLLLPERYE
jgi:hypothetical protein